MKNGNHFGSGKPYNDFTSYCKRRFRERVQKISVDAGFTCPNRDGTKGTGGCTYCNNTTFSPFYCHPEKSVTSQLEEGIAFFSQKYKTQLYFAYFQTYTNTYGRLERIKSICEEALSHPKVIGIVIATRPDCIDRSILEYFSSLSLQSHISIEYGVESFNDRTLELVNRCHSSDDSREAIMLTAGYGISTGAHLIIGLPGENHDVIMQNAEAISELPISTLKLHQLQIIKGTEIEKLFHSQPELFADLSLDNYIELVIDFAERLNPDIIIERFTGESPKQLVRSPDWGGMKNFEIVSKIERRMKERNTWQGRLFTPIYLP